MRVASGESPVESRESSTERDWHLSCLPANRRRASNGKRFAPSGQANHLSWSAVNSTRWQLKLSASLRLTLLHFSHHNMSAALDGR